MLAETAGTPARGVTKGAITVVWPLLRDGGVTDGLVPWGSHEDATTAMQPDKRAEEPSRGSTAPGLCVLVQASGGCAADQRGRVAGRPGVMGLKGGLHRNRALGL